MDVNISELRPSTFILMCAVISKAQGTIDAITN